MAELVNNFGLVTVSGTYNAAATSITLQSGHGSKLPATTGGYRFRLTWWDAGTYAHPADDPFVEIVLVTNRAGDVLTVVRGQEGTSASSKNTSGAVYRMSLGNTAEMWNGLRAVKSTHQGLVLQTDRDAGDALNKVELVACDYLVMTDGSVLRNDNNEWTGKTADITVSGAGGLDTGTEEVSVWYEVHAIAKEDDTRALLLHKSALWAIATSSVAGEDSGQNVRSATSNLWVGQGFGISSGRPAYAQAKLRKIGAPTGSIICDIYTDNAGVPGTVVASAHRVDVARLPSVDVNVRFTFPSSAPVLSALPTKYHMVIGGNWTIDATNYIQWRMDGSAATVPNGSKSIWSGTWAADTDDDMIFEIGTEQNVSLLTMPTDYTRSCFLGWVYNNGSSNFVPFVQHGRRRRTAVLSSANCSIGTLDGTVQVKDLNAMVPPLELCSVLMGIGGTGTQAGLLAVGDLQALDISVSGDTTGALAVLNSGMTSTKPGGFQEVTVQKGACMMQGTSGAKVWVAGFSW